MPTDRQTVSVIMPAYRSSKTIQRALKSIADQTVKPLEVVVVDDGSDDDTAEKAESMRATLSPIQLVVVRQPQSGAGAARNRAIIEARGDWLAFLDSDDAWRDEKVARTFEALEGCGYSPVIISHDVAVHEGDTVTNIDCAVHDVGDKDPFHAMYRRGYISTSTAWARRDAVVECGGFDPSLANAQDFDLWLALLDQSGARAHVFRGTYTDHYRQPASIQTHTSRRLRCASEIVVRYARSLRRHPGSWVHTLVFRSFAINAEAVMAYLGQRRYSLAAMSAVATPVRMLLLGARSIFAGPHLRAGWLLKLDQEK